MTLVYLGHAHSGLTAGAGQAICDVIIRTIYKLSLKEDIKLFNFYTTVVNNKRLICICGLLES